MATWRHPTNSFHLISPSFQIRSCRYISEMINILLGRGQTSVGLYLDVKHNF